MRPTTILYVEDNRLVRRAVREMLEAEGWLVETCEDGQAALARIEGREPYDLLLLDNDLPGVSGLELVRRARGMAHRRQTPLLMISASECELEARRAGADGYLRKPEDVCTMVETIRKLLAESRSK